MSAFDAVGMDAVGTTPSSQTSSNTITLIGTNGSESSASSSGAATVTPAQAGVVNLIGTNANETGASSTGAATVIPANAQVIQATVPASRTAVFAAHSRVATFTDSGPVTLAKNILDQLYIVGNFAKPLSDGQTSASNVTIVNSTVTVLEGATIQGSLMVAKIGAFDPSGGQFTFRVTCLNGEIIDGTVMLTAVDDRTQVFGKDPDDHRFYGFDISADLALSSNTTISSVQVGTTVGVNALSLPAFLGGKSVVLVGGLDLSGGINSCELVATLSTTEVIHRTAYFYRQDH